jgi:hypothetical protein
MTACTVWTEPISSPCRLLTRAMRLPSFAPLATIDVQRANYFLSLDNVTCVDRYMVCARYLGRRRPRCILGHRSVCVDRNRRRRADRAEDSPR